jgi:hypothetical protein
MAVGRNLAYKKEDFFRVKGFINHMKIKSGDDDLFIQDAANKENTSICIDPKTFTISQAPKSFPQWFRQKRRHISTSSHYRFQHKFLLGVFFITKLLFWLFFPLVFYYWSEPMLYIPVGAYIIANFISVGFAAKKLKETGLLYLLPILEIFLVLFQITIFMTNAISKPTHWK